MNSKSKNTKSFFDSNTNIIILIFAIICMVSSIAIKLSGMSGNDFWWHLKAGQWIFENKTIPTKALFTWYGESQSLNWFAHEWLSEVVFYLIYHAFGTFGMYEVCLYAGMLIIGATVVYNRNYIYNNYLLSSIYMLYFVIVITQFFFGRPHTINMILLFILLYILYKYKEYDTNLIFLLPVLSVLWVNLHGGSSNLIYIMPIIFVLSSLISFEYGKLKSNKMAPKKLLKLSVITIISSLLLLINPRGFEMIVYPYTNMADTAMLTFLSEWNAPDIKVFSKLIMLFVPVILVTAMLMLTHKKIDLTDFLIYGFYTYMFFRSQRFISLFMIATSFFFFKYIMPFKDKKKAGIKANANQNKITAYTSIGLFLVILVFQLIFASNFQKNNSLIDKILPEQFVNLIKEDNPKRLYNDYTSGGPLIFNNVKVFIDGRADIYTGSTFKNYQTMKYVRNYNPEELNDEDYMETLLKKYDFDAFLVENKTPIYHYLCQSPDKYKLIESDGTYSYFTVK